MTKGNLKFSRIPRQITFHLTKQEILRKVFYAYMYDNVILRIKMNIFNYINFIMTMVTGRDEL
jgi:hypothetical protein